MAGIPNMRLTKLTDLLNKVGSELTSEMKTRLKGSGKVNTGKLLNSIKYKVTEKKDSVELDFTMLEYGEWVDQGRKPGKQPPLDKIRKWCIQRGIPVKAAYPIARSIGKHGISPTYFFTTPLARRKAQISKQIEQVMRGEVVKSLEDYIKKNLK